LFTAGLSLACATYEPTPVRDHESPATPGGSAGTSSGGKPSGPVSGAGTTHRAGSGSAGTVSAFGGTSAGNATGGTSGGGAAGEPTNGAGGEPIGSGGGPGGTGLTRSWTFDSGADGWLIREQSAELQASLSEVAGALQLVDVPFSATKQFVDLAHEFDAPADLSGRTLRATIQRTSGGFVGAQLYVYAGQWVSPGFESLTSGDVIELSLSLDSVTDAGFTAASVARIGIKLSTGSNESNTFGATSVRLSEVTVD
jgi:hypothetical protein